MGTKHMHWLVASHTPIYPLVIYNIYCCRILWYHLYTFGSYPSINCWYTMTYWTFYFFFVNFMYVLILKNLLVDCMGTCEAHSQHVHWYTMIENFYIILLVDFDIGINLWTPWLIYLRSLRWISNNHIWGRVFMLDGWEVRSCMIIPFLHHPQFNGSQ